MVTSGLMSCNSCEWETPQELFDELNQQYRFTLDPASSDENAKCAKHYTRKENGLAQDWGGERVFCNPPYGREVADWVAKCKAEAEKPNTLVVALLAARTDTRWFHENVYGFARIVFLRGRVRFELGGERTKAAPFPSMVCVWGGE